ncbi:unnamed protein product, partial [Laminaria digitata]
MLTFLTVYQQWLLGNQDVEDDILDLYYILAAGAGFNTLHKTMSMPRYGSYTANGDGELIWSSYEKGGDYEIKMGDGRRFRSLYDGDSGYFYFSRMLESGHFWEWLGAMYVAIEPVARTVAVDTAADRQAFLVPYYLVFEDEITSLFNAQLTDKYYMDAPRLDMTSGQVMHPPAFTLNGGGSVGEFDPMTGVSEVDLEVGMPIKLEGNLTQELYAALYGIAFFNELYTQHYVDQARVFKMGNAEALVAGEGHEVDSFTDPLTGLAYGVIRPIGGSVTPGLGEELVNEGKRLARAYNNGDTSVEFEIGSVVDTINMLSAIVKFY